MCETDTNDGFSTIELLAGVALMGIIAAIALPNWRGLFPTYALNNSTRQIQSELHHLKMRAAAENVMGNPAYRAGSKKIGDSFRATGGIPQALREIDVVISGAIKRAS